MFLNSLKQLFRRPAKALIFFLLLAASTALLSFAAVSMTETRPYYLARTPGVRDNNAHFQAYSNSVHIVEFTPIDDSISKSKLEPMKVRIEKVHYEKFDYENETIIGGWHEYRLEPGNEVYIIQPYAQSPIMFRLGKTYMGNLEHQRNESMQTGLDIFSPMNPPRSTLYDPENAPKSGRYRIP